MNRKEVGKRKGGFTCIDRLLDRKMEDGYRYRWCVGGVRVSWRNPDRSARTCISSSEEMSLYMQWIMRIWEMKEMIQY